MKKSILYNTTMLYGLSIAKIVFPLLTLPYLTRILSIESYGTVSYVKAVMQYLQILVDFGFILSGTKKIVEVSSDSTKLGKITGDILLARMLLALLSFITLLFLMVYLPILRKFWLFTLLSFIPVFLSIFLFDYLFRGIEQMQTITFRFLLMRGVSTVLTFIVVKDDKDILMIPILDIFGTLIAIYLIHRSIKKLNISVKVNFDSIFEIKKLIFESANYFFSNMATTAFGALNTLLIGMILTTKEVAYWSICMQLIGAIQILYNPIIDGIYPEMVKTKDMIFIKKTLYMIMPLIFLGCIIAYLATPYGLMIVGGIKYLEATPLFRALIPVLFFSFPAMLIGWPALGVLGKENEVLKSTILTALFQIIGITCIIILGNVNILYIAFLRIGTEMLLFLVRLYYLKLSGVNLLS